jgi:MinD-like ATPase involved in chromosome partitioning or flagellar assembly
MSLNGHHRNLRVLLTGSAADRLAATFDGDAAVSVVKPTTDGTGLRLPASVDVALHVLEDSSSSADMTADLRRLRELDGVPLILAAYGEPNGIVETGLAVGAVDVLVLPQPAETLLFALRKAAMGAQVANAGKVVTVYSPKGGSGKTVISTNLAVAAARSGIETLLVDLDLQFGDSALTLSLSPRATIADLAASSGVVDVEKLNAFVVTDPQTGLKLLPSPKRPEEAEIVGQAELGRVLDTAREAYGAVVIDTGPLFDGAMLAALDRSDQLLLVCNPEVTSLKNVHIGLDTIDRLGFPRERVFVVANRLGAAGAVGRDEIEEALGTKIAFALPDDPAVPAAINRAMPVVLANAGSRFAGAIAQLATAVFADAPVSQSAPQQRRFLSRGRR